MPKSYQVVVIDEATCIGCTKCIQVCPVDAIVGASKQMHSVLTEYCIGCELCLPPCPVNCISIEPDHSVSQEKRREQAQVAKSRHQARKHRLQRQAQEKREKDNQVIKTNIKDLIAGSLARSQQKNLSPGVGKVKMNDEGSYE